MVFVHIKRSANLHMALMSSERTNSSIPNIRQKNVESYSTKVVVCSESGAISFINYPLRLVDKLKLDLGCKKFELKEDFNLDY